MVLSMSTVTWSIFILSLNKVCTYKFKHELALFCLQQRGMMYVLFIQMIYVLILDDVTYIKKL